MKTFQVTWVQKAYYVVEVEAEDYDAVSKKVEEDWDSFFSGKDPVDYDCEVFYEEVAK